MAILPEITIKYIYYFFEKNSSSIYNFPHKIAPNKF